MTSLLSESDDNIAISALQHLLYCERQAALIHVERLWEDSDRTALGQIVHARTNEPGSDLRRGVRVDRALPLRCRRLGLAGVADCVEWIAGGDGIVRPRPVETKRGRVIQRLADQVQLCAQALCLEEMLAVEVQSGSLFYAASHRRIDIPFTEGLRQTTEAAASRMHELMRTGTLPPPAFGAKCKRCSLMALCQPQALQRPTRASRYLAAVFEGLDDLPPR